MNYMFEIFPHNLLTPMCAMHTLCVMNPTDLMPSSQVCEALTINRSTLSRWVAAGTIVPAVKLDGLRGPMLFDPADVARVKAEREAAA